MTAKFLCFFFSLSFLLLLVYAISFWNFGLNVVERANYMNRNPRVRKKK